jgi:hypothetical protein
MLADNLERPGLRSAPSYHVAMESDGLLPLPDGIDLPT